ncbi:MAG: phenylalanine--tRNA ligase subunit beta, partial [Bacteroidetes bacterium]|nr:phenylalanine--tRNA ligase subunit beta [Bacteroidota bacterium]
FALKRAALLIQQVAGGDITMEPKVIEGNLSEFHEVDFSTKRCNQLIGAALSEELIEKILTSLEIEILTKSTENWKLKVPGYRVDVTREADVIEEILRIYGFNKVEIPAKLNSSLPNFPKPNLEAVQSKVSEMLVGMGFSEMMNNSLTTSEYVKKFGNDFLSPERDVQILNPLSLELNVMRQSLIFQCLASAAFNQNRQNPDLKLFEFGKIYQKFEKYEENKRLVLLATGKNSPENWNSQTSNQDFYSIKAYALSVFKRLGLDTMVKFKPLKKSILEDGLQVFVLQNKVGEIGWTSSAVRKYFGLKQNVFIADLDWDMIIQSLSFSKIKYQELPKTFATRRDFSLLLNTEVTFGELEELARNADKKILKEVGLFDVYEGKNLPEGKKSYALSFIFQDSEKTLQDQQVDAVMDKIRSSFEQKLGAELR